MAITAFDSISLSLEGDGSSTSFVLPVTLSSVQVLNPASSPSIFVVSSSGAGSLVSAVLGVAGSPATPVITFTYSAGFSGVSTVTLGVNKNIISIPLLPQVVNVAAVAPLPTTSLQGTSPWVVSGSVSVTNFPATQPVSLTSTTITGSVAVTGAFYPATQPVSGTFWPATQPVSLTSTTITGSVAVTGTFWPATQPVSGAFYQATQPVSIAAPVAVTGTFWQATQPVSGTINTVPGVSTSATVACKAVTIVALIQSNVKTSAGNVYGLTVSNKSSQLMYLQFFNTTGTPTIGTGVVWSVPVSYGATVIIPPSIFAMGNFTTGIGVAAGASATGTGTLPVAPDVTIWYD